MRAGLDGLDGFMVHEGDERRMEACQSPVWDTALALVALGDAGIAPEHPAIERGARWLAGRGGARPAATGPSAGRTCPPGGWAFEFENDWYPDVDDTAEVVLALRRSAVRARPRRGRARGRAGRSAWQSKDGAWGAFDADNVALARPQARRSPTSAR